MGIELRLPNITGVTEKEQLLQIKSYLYQLSQQLQYAFETVNTSSGDAQSSSPVATHAYTGNSSSGAEGSNAKITFDQIKSLIIKSADIVDAYYEEINKKLEGVYVAESVFGTYAESTSQTIIENSKATTQQFQNVQVLIKNTASETETAANAYADEISQSISGKITETQEVIEEQITATNVRVNETNNEISKLSESLGNVSDKIDENKASLLDSIDQASKSLSESDKLLESANEKLKGSLDDLQIMLNGLSEIVLGITAYIKSGILYYTTGGVPVYGIEIGQEVESNGNRVFSKFSRFTSEKLSFYDQNDNEVAYISDKKLYIGQAEITTSFKIGGIISLVLESGDVIKKWVGKG